MFGVLLDGPYDVMFYNQVVVNNTSLPKFTLGKKHNAVSYYVVHNASTAGILLVVK